MSHEASNTIIKMTLLTVTGWTVSMQDVIEVAKLLSFAVPTALSVLVYWKDQRNKKRDDEQG